MDLLPELIKLIQLNIPEILTFGLSLVIVIFGKKYRKLIRIFQKLSVLLTTVVQASNDDQYTQTEVNTIFIQMQELLDEFKVE